MSDDAETEQNVTPQMIDDAIQDIIEADDDARALRNEGADKSLDAPRITPQMLEDLIVGEYIATADKMFPGAPILPGMNIYTVCILVLKSGFIVAGHSAPVSPANFDAELGRELARRKAINKIWPLEGYRLKCELAAAK